jgi:hypothetical protein
MRESPRKWRPTQQTRDNKRVLNDSADVGRVLYTRRGEGGSFLSTSFIIYTRLTFGLPLVRNTNRHTLYHLERPNMLSLNYFLARITSTEMFIITNLNIDIIVQPILYFFHSLIPQSVLGQLLSLFQSEFSTENGLVLPPSISNSLPCP